MTATRRMTVTPDTACAVADALAYYLLASSNNYGSGWEDTDEDRQAQAERAEVERFLHRLEPPEVDR